MEKYKLTVATTTYNQEKFIGACIDGIVMQNTNFAFKLVISDDCSTDNTKKILKEYEKKYPNIVKPIFRKKNLGPMDNFIETLNEIDTEYVAFCDGDDFWTDPNKLQKQVDFLDNNKDYTICFHLTKVFFEDNSKEEEIVPLYVKDTTTFDDILKECYIPANSVVYRWNFRQKNSLKKIFPKNVVPGDYFIHLLHARNGKIKLINEVMSNYRRHESGMWWLTSQPDTLDEFHLKYGYKYLNFFKAVEKEFNLPDYYNEQKKYLCIQTIKVYINNHLWDELSTFEQENQQLISNCFLPENFKSGYQKLPRSKKLVYMILIDRTILKEKLKNHFGERSIIYKFYNFIAKNKNFLKHLFISLLIFIITLLFYLLFSKIFNTEYYISNICSWIISTLFICNMNGLITFNQKCNSKKQILKQSVLSIVLFSSLIVLNILTFYIFFSMFKFNDVISASIACIISIILNNLINLFLIKQNHKGI